MSGCGDDGCDCWHVMCSSIMVDLSIDGGYRSIGSRCTGSAALQPDMMLRMLSEAEANSLQVSLIKCMFNVKPLSEC